MKGWRGKILEVDLTRKELKELKLPESVYKDYLGGSGLAAKIFFDRKLYKVEPLSPENLLMFITGPLTGTTFPGCARYEVSSRSPLTNMWGEASCGAGFGPELKRCGYDGIIVGGAASAPVYLWINDGNVEIKDASSLWGKDNYEIEELLQDIHQDKKISIASIGPAGENLVRYAAILTDRGDAAARCGLGAVMGAKRLKAIVLRGKKKIEIAQKEEFEKLRKRLVDKIKLDPLTSALHKYGTNSGMQLGMQIGDVPTKNFRKALWEEGVGKIDGVAITENILQKTKACFACPIACKRVVKVDKGPYKVDGPGPEYESAASLGTLLYNDNLAVVAYANELCNRLGMDTISCGSSIAFAMECYEAGILTKKDTDGLELNFGNSEAVITLIKKIAQREGIGDLLAEGVKRAAEKLGKGSEKFALHIKGMEVPMHDPRAYHGLALTYSTSTRGACHTHDMNLMIEMGVSKYPEIMIKGGYKPLSPLYRADFSVKSQNFGMIYGSAVICYFVASIISAKDLRDMISTTCGWDLSLEDMMKIGERVWYLKRSLGNLCGMSAKDDNLPERLLQPYIEGTTPGVEKVISKMMSLKPPENPTIRRIANNFTYDFIFPRMRRMIRLMNYLNISGKRRMKKNPYSVVPDLKRMLTEFYKLRNLREDGKPERESLENLGLKEVADELGL